MLLKQVTWYKRKRNVLKQCYFIFTCVIKLDGIVYMYVMCLVPLLGNDCCTRLILNPVIGDVLAHMYTYGRVSVCVVRSLTLLFAWLYMYVSCE